MSVVVVAQRFCGPETSGNGGYVSGLLGKALGGAVEVTLKAPPPLDTPLTLARTETGATLRHGEVALAVARPQALDIAAPPAPALDEAEAASARYAGLKFHLYPHCFVCGPARAAGDGLRIFAGPSEDESRVIGPWIPEGLACDADGRVEPEFVWAALDCPGFFAFMKTMPALLGRMNAQIYGRPRLGERCVVAGWKIASKGRKHDAASAVYSGAGDLLGLAKTTWIELPRERIAGSAVSA
jgi:hypothetical protein